MFVNSDPQVIMAIAMEIRDSYKKIYENTHILNNELNKFGSTLDEETYRNISANVKSLISKIDKSEESVLTICKKLIEYAKIIDEANKRMN